MSLTPRWTRLRYHPEQNKYWHSIYRFNVVPAGRRSGKTEIAKRRLVRRAIGLQHFPDARYFAAAPTRDQAKRIYWSDLKALVPREFILGRPSETELAIELVSGATIYVVGMDRPERIEGVPSDGGILDEYGNMKPGAWGAHVRPALADRSGYCDLIGVPEGRNHYWDLYQHALAQMTERGTASEWAAWHWLSADILPPSEIAAARSDLDELTFQQEFEGSFVTFTGRCYYPFDARTHSKPLTYDPHQPLIFCFDFNVSPGVAAICQEQRLPNGLDGTGVIGEVWIPRNSNTIAVCQRLIADWGKHEGRILCYGDATGGARGSAKVAGSDWDLVRGVLQPVFSGRLAFKVPHANPPERARVNAVNSRLKSAAGDIRLMVDATKAPHVVKDFEGVILLEGGSGEIDKQATPSLTHLSDGISYYIYQEYPLADRKIIMRKISGF